MSITPTYSLHCSSFLGLPSRFLDIKKLVKPKKGTTMETAGSLAMKGPRSDPHL